MLFPKIFQYKYKLIFFQGIKNKIRDMILSYNSLWLRIGLEVGFIVFLTFEQNVCNKVFFCGVFF